MKKILLILLGVFCLLAGALLARTARFTSRQIEVSAAQEIKLDREAMVTRLSEAVRHKTVSYAGATEFERLHAFLAKSFPAVHTQLTKEVIGGQSLFYAWKGQDSGLKPILLMAHLDVVPVDPTTEKSWTYPPLSGRMADGYLWGRGTMDDKAGVVGILEAVEYLLTNGFKPRRTIYLAFGHDEEIGGSNGAAKIAELLRARGVELDFVLDEGGNIVEGIIPRVSVPVALIGVAEKGYVSLELTVEAPGGHASTPPPQTAIGTLSRAIDKLERSPFPSRLTEPVRKMLEFIGPEMTWHKRIILANLWLFGPLVRREFARSPMTDATIRTTQAATIFETGVKENVLPAKARAVVNARILPGDTIAQVIDHARKAVDDSRVKIAPLAIRVEPSPVADTESPGFKLIHRTIREVAPEVLVAPSLLVAATDSRHYANLSRNIFRFLPITIRAEDARRFHGIDERIAVKDYERCVRFFVQLIRNSQP